MSMILGAWLGNGILWHAQMVMGNCGLWLPDRLVPRIQHSLLIESLLISFLIVFYGRL